MSITFSVIDLNCEALDRSFFVPNIVLKCKSTTTIATLLGYSEFLPSTPPKKYKKVVFNGTSSRVGFTGENPPRQCGGAKYVYSGTGEIDSKGNQLTNYAKDFFAQCAKQYWPLEPLQNNPDAINTGGSIPRFVSFCWPTDPNSCSTCDPDPNNWPFVANQSTNNPSVDLAAFIHNVNSPVITSTSFSVNDVFHAFTSIDVNVPFTFTSSGSTYTVTVGSHSYPAESVFTIPPTLNFPAELISGIIGEYIIFTDTNNYSAVLSNEYTDAEALANAKVITGTGATAQNFPRGNTFVSRTTSVVFDLVCGNLISGSDYLVTIDLWDQDINSTSNTHTTKSYGFTANSTSHTIVDIIPTPAAGHVITVQNPKIAFI